MARLSAHLKVRFVWLVAFVVVLAAFSGFAVYRDYRAEQARALANLRTERVGRGDIVAVVSSAGVILPEKQASLFFFVPGTVVEVPVETGDQVRAGQVLARLDAAALELAVHQAEDALAVAKLNRQKLLAGPDPGDIAVAEARLRSATAAAADLRKGAGAEEVTIAQIRYDGLLADYQEAANRYNSEVYLPNPDPPSPEVLELLKINMEAAYYAAEIGRLQLEQVKRGAGRGALSVAGAQVAQAEAALNQLQVAPTELQVQMAEVAVAQAQLALEQARLRASRVSLVAPFAGVVAAVNARVGEPAVAGVPAIVLLDNSRLHMDVAVHEADVVRLQIGQAGTVTVDALPGRPLGGRVDFIAPTATSVGGIVNYTVRVLLDSTQAALRSGMSATAEIVVAEARDVVLVPNWAIRRDRRTGQAYAGLKVGDQLTEVPIVTGLRGEAYTEVTGGVEEGDLAAVSTVREQIDLFGGG